MLEFLLFFFFFVYVVVCFEQSHIGGAFCGGKNSRNACSAMGLVKRKRRRGGSVVGGVAAQVLPESF